MAPSHVMDTELVISVCYHVIWTQVNSIVCVHSDSLACIIRRSRDVVKGKIPFQCLHMYYIQRKGVFVKPLPQTLSPQTP